MELLDQIGNIDIYLFDQLIKGRLDKGNKVLDAGCGRGRNMHWLYSKNFDLYGVDSNEENIDFVRKKYPNISENLAVSSLENLSYSDQSFQFIICSAVMHFAQNKDHFLTMFSELVRILDKNGILFIRMTSDFGVKDPFESLGNGLYILRDGSTRFLLTESLLDSIMKKHKLEFIDPIKTTNVENLRCMTTLVLKIK